MKKKLLIIVSVLVAFAIAVVFVLIFVEKNNSSIIEDESSEISNDVLTTPEKTFEQQLIKISNCDEFEKLIKDEQINVVYSDDKTSAFLYEFDFWESLAEMTVDFDERDIKTCNIYFSICDISELSENINSNIYNVCKKAINDFSGLFECQYDHFFQLSNYDGTFTNVESADDIVGLINEESYIDFAVRDENGYYYVMQISVIDSALMVEIKKFLDVNYYIDYVANISLYEGA